MKPKIWTIPVTWEVYSTVEVEAFTLAEAYRYVEEDSDDLPLPTDADYVDDSFHPSLDDIEEIRYLYNDGQQDTDVQLSTGKRLTAAEIEELREILLQQNDIEDIYIRINSGFFNGDRLFAKIPDCEIPGIAEKKAVYERQQGFSWENAADQAIADWCDTNYRCLLDILYAAYQGENPLEKISEEEFEEHIEGFRNPDYAQSRLSPENYRIWLAVVPQIR